MRILLSVLFSAALAVGAIAPADAASNPQYGLSVSFTFDQVGNGRFAGTFHVRNFGPTRSNRYRLSFMANPKPAKGSVWGTRLYPVIPAGMGYQSELSRSLAVGKERTAGATWPLVPRLLLGSRYCWAAGVSNSDGGYALFNEVTCIPPGMNKFQLGLGVVRPKRAVHGRYPMLIYVRNWGKTQSDGFIVASTGSTQIAGVGFNTVSSDEYNQQTTEQPGLAPGKQRLFKVTAMPETPPCPSISLSTSSGATISVELCQAD